MNYYIIPRYISPINIKLCISNPSHQNQKQNMSNSLLYYLKDVQQQIYNIANNGVSITDELTIEYISKIVNPYEFINTVVPRSNIAVSKINTQSNIYFELIEIFNTLELNEILTNTSPIHVGHITPNYESSIFFFNMYRQIGINLDTHFTSDTDTNFDSLVSSFVLNKHEQDIDLFICEFKMSDYNDVNKLLLLLCTITNNQKEGGHCIIKIDHISYEIIAEIILILSAMYRKVYLIKPSVSNVTIGYRYLVCNTYLKHQNADLVEQIHKNVAPYLANTENSVGQIVSIVANEIPYFLFTKLNEINIIIGQQQLDAYDQIINIYKNKNKQDTLESLKRKHLQRCIQWCEKYNLPHNKFVDKINIFLNST